ncbi:MAG: transposase family protein [Dehalococcoidia bacterium]|nr:transposase family protein [Dehalococcoidia bacterium]
MDDVLVASQLCEMAPPRSLAEALAEVPDPRRSKGKRHELAAVLALAVCAMLCGSRSLYAIAQWGRDHGPEMAEALGFRRRKTPCVATLHRVFKKLDRDKFEAVLGQWFCERGLQEGEAIALDGKSMRGIHGEELPSVHLVAAFAHYTGTVLAQKGGKDQRGRTDGSAGGTQTVGFAG